MRAKKILHKTSAFLLSLMMLLSNIAPVIAYAMEEDIINSKDDTYVYQLTSRGYKVKSLTPEGRDRLFLNKELVIPEKHNDIPIVEIADNALTNESVERITLPKTLKVIGDYALYNDDKGFLEEIIAEDLKLDKIGKKAFANNKLTETPLEAEIIEESAYENNEIEEVVLLDTKIIESNSFTENKLKEVLVNKNSVIADNAFDKDVKINYIEKDFPEPEEEEVLDYIELRRNMMIGNEYNKDLSQEVNFVEPEELDRKEFEDLKEKSITPKRLSFLDYFVKTVHASDISESDGTKIETITSKWVDTNENHQTLKWDDDEEKLVKLRTSYSLSGQHDYDPGTIQISIPKNIFKDRNNQEAGYMTLGVPVLPGGSTEFAYYDTGDKYILINTKVIKAATQGMFEATFRGLIPHTIVDKSAEYITDEYKATISVTTRNNNIISMESNSLTADVDTGNEMTYASIEGDVVYEGWPSSWNRNLIPEDIKNPEDYIYATWRTYGKNVGNQTFKIDFEDSVNNGGYTTNGRVVAIRRNSDMSFHKSDNIENFFPGNGKYGYSSSDKSYFTEILTAYPKSDFFNEDGTSKKSYFDLTNKIKYTLTSEDDKQTTSKEATSTIRYVPVLPFLPTGHFIVRKCPGTPTYIPERYCEPVDSYPIHLNNIIANKEAEVIYRIRPQAFGLPWTSEDDVVEEGKLVDFSKYEKVPYEIEIRDNKLKFNGEDELLEKGDYEFSKIKFNKPDTYSYKKTDKDIYSYYENASGVVAYGKVPEGRYAYIKEDSNIDFEVFVAFEKDGSFEKLATVNNSNGKISIDPINGASANEDELIFPKGVVDYKVISKTSKAAVIWDMDVSVKLLPSDKIKSKVEAMFKETSTPKAYLYNAADMNVRLKGSKENTFINEDGGQNTLEGFAYGVNITKTLRYENQPSLRNVKLHYKAETEIQTNLIKEEDLKESIEKGYFKEEKVATWYDLLPKGVTPDTSTISVRKKDEVLDIEVIDNYKDSGRTLLKVIVKQTPDYKLKYKNIIGQDGLVDTPILEFDANYSWESILDLGKNLRNQIVYESHNEYLGNYRGLSGEKDNPTGENHSNTLKAVREDVKEILTDLNKDNDNPSFIYAASDVDVEVDKSAITSLTKYVDTEGKGIYSDGLDEINSGNVYENQTYNYRLRIQNPIDVKANNIVFYDKLEGYTPTKDKLDHGDKQWQGTLMSIDTSQLELMGVKPVVYYSVKKDIVLDNTKDRSHNDLSNKEIWTTNKPENPREITAIAIDASKDKNGNDFVLESNKSLSVIANMKAPDLKDEGYVKADKEKEDWYDTQREVESVNRRIIKVGNQEYVYTNNIYSTEEGLNGGAHAYNNAITILNTMSAEDTSKKEELLIRHDYTKVGLKPYNIDVEKIFNDGNDRDGKRPEQVKINLLADGKVVKTTVLNKDNEWKGRFEFLPYINSDGKEIKYTFEEEGAEDYKLSIKEEYIESDVKKVVLENYYEPVKVNVPVRKTWKNVQEYPESITYILKADGKEVNRVTVKPDANGSWDYTFKNLYKYRDGGKEIIYTLDELNVEDYAKTINGSDIINEYKPYGDLKISKNLTNASDKASKENEFSFTLYIEAVNNEDENRKVGNYKYEKSNGEKGLITNGSTFTLKSGENILIKDVDSRFKYKVVENKIDYFKANQESIEGEIKSSYEAEEVAFVNDYHTKGEIRLDVKKDLDGRKLRARQFRFNVYDDKDELVSVGFNDEDGNVVFNPIPVDNNDLGLTNNILNANNKKTYTIKEVNRGELGYEYDSKTVTAEVLLEDNGHGKINTKIKYKDDKILDFNENTFSYNNKYKASGDVKIKAWKYVKFNKDNDYSGYKFKLSLKDILDSETGDEFDETNIDKNRIHYSLNKTLNKTFNDLEAVSDKEGNINFPDIKFNQYDAGKTFVFDVSEVKGNDDKLIYDSSVIRYYINVHDNADGTLAFESDYKFIADDKISIDDYKKNVLNILKSFGEDEKQIEEKLKTINNKADLTKLLNENQNKYPLFVNEFKSGNLKVSKKVQNGDKNKYFKFKVKLKNKDGNIPDGDFKLKIPEPKRTPVEWEYYPERKEFVLRPSDGGDIGYFAEGQKEKFWEEIEKEEYEDCDFYIDKKVEAPEDSSWLFGYSTFKSLDLLNLDTSNVTNMESMFAYSSSTKLDLSNFDTSNVTDMRAMFESSEATSLDLSSFNTSNVTDMGYMFPYSRATSLDLSSFKTSNVTNMDQMFRDSQATSIDLSNFDTSNVTNMNNMFYNSQATSLDLSSFKTSNVTNMGGMFSGSEATSLDLSRFDTNKVTDMDYMFSYSQATSIDLSNFDTRNVTSMRNMFSNSQARSLDLSSFNTSNVTIMSNMFSNSQATRIDLSNFDTSNVIRMYDMFYNSQARSLDLSSFNTSNVTSMSSMFEGSRATSIDLSNFDTSNVTSMRNMFSNSQVQNLKSPQKAVDRFKAEGDLKDSVNITITDAAGETHGNVIHSGTQGGVTWEIFEDGHLLFRPTNGVSGIFNNIAWDRTSRPWTEYNDKIKSISFNKGVKGGDSLDSMFEYSQATSLDLSSFDTSSVTSMNSMFEYSQATSLDLSSFDTSNVTTMGYMFRGSQATSLDLSSFDTSSVTYMSRMFMNSQATSLDLSSFDTSSVTDMRGMFGDSKATSLDLSSFDTSNVTDMNGMFFGSQATNLDLSSFDTSSVTDMYVMFASSQATSLDLSSFDTSNVTTMGYMFHGSQATSLDLSNFDTSNVTNMYGMFQDSKATSLDLSSFDTSSVTGMYGMFQNSKATRLDLSSFDTSNVTSMRNMFSNSQVQKIKTSPNMKITDDMKFPRARADYENTGNWIREDKAFGPYTKEEMVSKYDQKTYDPKTEYGTWIAEPMPTEYNINFDKNNDKAIGDMVDIKAKKDENVLMPNSSYIAKNQRVIGYSKDPNATDPEYRVENSYKNIGNVGETVTLYAIWEDINTDLRFVNGELEFYLKDGDTVELPDLPANSDYEIYEETEAGWSLIESSKDRGKIKSNETIEANFVNNYNPEIAYAKIKGSKLLEGDTVDVKGYEFEVLENEKVLYTLTSDENGNFETPLIEYKEAGIHTYTIREESKSTSKILKDESEFIVTVNVSDNNGVLNANVSYPENIIFNNKRVKKSLTIKKVIESNLENLDGEFKVKVSLSNENKDRIVTLNKANNYTATIGNLLEGTSYEIEEIDIPEGYSLKSYSNETGIIGDKNEVTITNKYESQGSFTLKFNKKLQGRELKDKEFEFVVYDENNEEVARSFNRVDGTIQDFGAIKLTTPGIHKFTVKEVKGYDNSIEYDNELATVTVNAEDNNNGQLVLKEQPVYSKETFINKVKPGTLTIRKEVDNIVTEDLFTVKLTLKDKKGKDLTDEYKVVSNKRKEQSIKSGGFLTIGANETLSIANLPQGTAYQVEEINIPEGYKKTKEDSVEGVIESNIVSEAKITNTYNKKGIYQIEGIKNLEGKDLEDGEFEFFLLNEDNSPIEKTKNKKDGSFYFKPINFTEKDLGTKTYKVIENKGEDNKVIYDNAEYVIKLKVEEVGSEIKVTEQTITKQGIRTDKILFNNKYDESQRKLVIQKTVKGDTKEDIKFNFRVSIQQPGKEETIRTIQIVNNGKVEFDNLAKDTKIKIKEFAIPENYKKESYLVDGIEIGEEEEFTLTKELTNVKIVNSKITNGSFKIKARKLYNEKPAKENQFIFELLNDKKGIIDSVKNDKLGNIVFDLNFKEEDLSQTHKTYYLREKKGEYVTIDYDESIYKVDFDLEKTKDSDIIVKNLKITKDGKEVEEIIFENKDKPVFDLPSTGKLTSLILIILSTLAVGYAILNRKKELV